MWHMRVFVSVLLIFCAKDVLCEISISQSPNPSFAGQYVTVTCTMNETPAPIVVDWVVQATDNTDSFTIDFSSCQYIGAAGTYTLRCSTQGTNYTTSMIISPVSEDDNGNQWTCTTSSSGESTPIALDVRARFSPGISIAQSPNPAIVGQDVRITCTAIDYDAPYLVDWNANADSLSIYFATCSYFGATGAYTLDQCSTDGFTYTASMVISSATKSDNGNQWSCTTASAGQSDTITIVVNAKSSASSCGDAGYDGLLVAVVARLIMWCSGGKAGGDGILVALVVVVGFIMWRRE